MRQVVDHLLITHGVPLEKRLHVIEAHTGELMALNRLQIGAAPLDAHHRHGTAAKIGLLVLERSVAAALQHQPQLPSDQA